MDFPKSLRFDGGLTCGLLHNKTDPINELFLSGTRIYTQDNGYLVWGNINNIEFPVSLILQSAALSTSNDSEDNSITSKTPDSTPYAILLESGVTMEQTYDDLIKAGHDDDSTSHLPMLLLPSRVSPTSCNKTPKSQYITRVNSIKATSTYLRS